MTPELKALSPDDKLRLARELCWAATHERRAKRRAEEAAHKCQCGHRRDGHSLSTSINYTEGWCRRCECRWFLMRAGHERTEMDWQPIENIEGETHGEEDTQGVHTFEPPEPDFREAGDGHRPRR